MQMSLPVVLISMLLFFVLFFGIGFLLNMLLRMTWIMAICFPIIAILIIDDVPWTRYLTAPSASLAALGRKVASLAAADLLILASGFAGALCAGWAIRTLRAKGYQMF
ncbi:hypothetical protein GS3922_01440 [Geobacillus subterraneus]|uniref:Membrane protein YuiB n=2 Tax=Geobacillus TaxID=129337 RepID=A0ABM6A878_9BACL|nr:MULTISPECIES: YuiB family protein [Geobacillus]AMX82456.1 hypothetical protein GS3922_01440 [Geobacillus subterraneus]KZS26389.1 hypothetical protein A5418_07875 [Geobacillus subterraneus]OQP07430.1 hypothetical protein B1690_02550 [Geobacillus sp. 46C-IIa]OXB91487.1 hypothetical protein B9L21_01230 [Geobacillus uzenensis]QIZ68819.1 hypothetical protein HF500_17365 [Geobacillus subterraneus]